MTVWRQCLWRDVTRGNRTYVQCKLSLSINSISLHLLFQSLFPHPFLFLFFTSLNNFSYFFFFCIQLNYFLLYSLNSIFHFSYFSRFQFFFYSGYTKIFQNLLMKINICKNVQVRRIDFLFRYFYSQFRVEIKLEEYLIFFYSNCWMGKNRIRERERERVDLKWCLVIKKHIMFFVIWVACHKYS